VADVLAELRAAFPVAELWVYFNHAAVAPVARQVEEAVAGYLRESRTQGSAGFAGWLERRETARSAAATLLGARSSEVAFTTSTSQGLLTVAEGLRLSPGDEIVTLQDDFPANRIPWWRQVRRGARIVEVPRRDGRVSAGDVLARLSPRTRLVAVSWVAYDHGQRLDLRALGAGIAARNEQAAREGRGAARTLFCVDAIQGLGVFPMQARAWGLDFLAADSHKWLLGLEGLGLFWCREEALAELDPPLISWWSMARPFAPWTPDAPWQPDARRFEFACLPTACLYGVEAALRMLLAAGAPALSSRVLELTARLARGLEAHDWQLLTPMGSEAERSGIVTARPPGLAPELAVERLLAAHVQVTPRGGGVRFSPHAWNTADEVDRALEALP
jgi:selenocysteine lyase/cysteine desulfurase